MLVSGMLCPPSSPVMQPPSPCVHWYLACWLVGCWFSGCLVGCCVGWLVVGGWVLGQLSLAGGLVGWLVAWFVVCWLVAGVCAQVLWHCRCCWMGCMCVCCLDTCCVVLLHIASLCKHVCAVIAKVLGVVVHISFWRSSGVLARCSSGVVAVPLRSLERR